MDEYDDMFRMRNEFENLKERISCAKLDLLIEKEKAPFLRAMLKMEQTKEQHLARFGKFYTDCGATMAESDEILHQLQSDLVGPDFRSEIYCVVEEILRERQKVSDERQQGHIRRMEGELKYHSYGQVIKAKSEELKQLEGEVEELDRQLTEEQAAIDNIAEEERETITVYQSNIRAIDLETLRYEAETAEIMVEIGRAIASSCETNASQPKKQSTTQLVAGDSTVPSHFREVDVVELSDSDSDSDSSPTELVSRADRQFEEFDRNAPVYALGHGDNKNKSSNGLSTEAGDQRELDTQQLPRPSSSASQPARPLPQTAIVSTENGRSELGLLRKSACPTEQKLVIKQSILQIITHPSRPPQVIPPREIVLKIANGRLVKTAPSSQPNEQPIQTPQRHKIIFDRGAGFAAIRDQILVNQPAKSSIAQAKQQHGDQRAKDQSDGKVEDSDISMDSE